MPLYEYKCGSCSKVFEAYKRLSENSRTETCPGCGNVAERVGISLIKTLTGSGSSGAGSSSCGSRARRSPFS